MLDASNKDRFRLLIAAVQDYGIFMLDPLGHVMSWNAGAERIKGYEESEVLGKHFSMFYPEDVRKDNWPDEELRRAQLNGRYEEEGWRVRKNGAQFWANVVITPLFSEGMLTGFAKVTRDLTERRAHEEALRQSEERLRLLIEGVRDYAIYMLDSQGFIQSWNSGAELIKGYKESEVIGRHYRLFFRSEDIKRGLPEKEIRDALSSGRTEEEGWRVRRDGSVFWANIVMTPIYGQDQRLMGFAKVTRDMSERRRLQDLEHSSKRLNEFIAMLAHELRNPLAPIRNAVSILQLEPAPSPMLRSCREMIDRQLSHMTRLVDDLLDAGRLTSGKIRIRPSRISFNKVAARSVEALRPQMDARHHAFVLDILNEEIEVNADETRLVQVIQNLLGNAVKFTPAGGTISLRARVNDGRLDVSVTDNGVGMTRQSMESIFELFSQGDGISLSHESGLGIGLSLVRSLVEMHGGSVCATSAGLGQGSVFNFQLPSATAQKRETSSLSLKSPLNILVVDDNRDAADSLAQILRLWGYRVATFYDGAHALEAARVEPFRAAFLDIGMPNMSGPELLRELRSLPGDETLFAAAVTGYGGHDQNGVKIDFTGFDAQLLKPVALINLRSVLKESKLLP